MPASRGNVLKAGKFFQARKLVEVPFQFNSPFQIIDGEFSGIKVPYENAIEVENEKTFTEKEWNDMENHYMHEFDKEREQKERAQQLVQELTETIKKKNAEIERLDFCVNVLAGSLQAMTEAFHKLKKWEKA